MALVCLGCALGCDNTPATTDSGVDGGAPPTDSGGADGGGDDGAPDAGPPRGLGEACTDSLQCEDGTSCFHPLSGIDLGEGYCTHSCATDTECSGFPADGFDYTCVSEGLAARCGRTCPGGFGCQDGHSCITGFQTSATDTADLCFDFRRDACASDADCSAPAHCSIQIDRERAVQFCYAPNDTAGFPLPLLGPGDACNPLPATPCSDASVCPTGWSCSRRAEDRRRVCTAPPAERCHLLCLLPGVCTGVCDTDADCPTDMRCSGGPYNFGPSTPEVGFDDLWVDTKLCTYAAGSRTACTRGSDCATTGTGGGAEACWPTTDAAGDANFICVTPGAGLVRQGQPCGDDPMTDAVEARACGGVCIGNVCGEACVADADCGTGSRCASFSVNADQSSGYCVIDAPCATTADCTGTDICGVVGESDGTVTRTCLPASGPLAPGDLCELAPPEFLPVAGRCAQGCANVGEGLTMGRCGEICDTDAECATDFRCAHQAVTLDNGGTLDVADDVNAIIGQCAYAPGSGSACTVTGDCPTGEYCAAFFDASLAVTLSCVTAVTGGAAVGEACTEAMGCAERSCLSTWLDLSVSACFGLCASDTDCPTGTACRRYRAVTDLTLCLPPSDGRGLPL